MKSIDTLVYVENSWQVEGLQKLLKNKKQQDFIILAISPSAQTKLLELNIPFTKSTSFFSKEDHIRVVEKGSKIIDLLEKNFELEDFYGLKHAYKSEFLSIFNFYFLNYSLSILILINNAFKELKPKNIILPPKIKIDDIENHVTSETSLLGNLGELYFLNHKINLTFLKNNKKSLKRKSSFFGKLFMIFIFKAQLLTFKIFSKNKKIIWSTSDSYNLPRVIDYLESNIENTLRVGGLNKKNKNFFSLILKRKFWKFFRFPPPAKQHERTDFLKRYDKEILKLSNIIKKNNETFLFQGVNLKDIFIDYFNNGLKNKILETFEGGVAFNKALEIKKPHFLIANQASGFHYAIGEICNNKNIKAMLISHGTHVQKEDKWQKKVWDDHAKFMISSHFPYVAIQTSWAKEFVDNQKLKVSKKVLSGPLLFSKGTDSKNKYELKKKLFPKHFHKKIFLHAASPFSWYVFHPLVNLSQDEYILHINECIKSIEKMEDSFLALRIRLKSFPNMSIEKIRSLLIESDCYEIYEDGEFEDYLNCSDLLISFSSTTIEEALQLKVPVLQYDPFDRYCHIPCTKMAKSIEPKLSSVYYVSNYDDLSWSLNWIKKNHLIKDNSSINLQIDWSTHVLKYSKNWYSLLK